MIPTLLTMVHNSRGGHVRPASLSLALGSLALLGVLATGCSSGGGNATVTKTVHTVANFTTIDGPGGGNTTINGGILNVPNWIPSSPFSVNVGAKLMGSGMVGNISSVGGIVSREINLPGIAAPACLDDAHAGVCE